MEAGIAFIPLQAWTFLERQGSTSMRRLVRKFQKNWRTSVETVPRPRLICLYIVSTHEILDIGLVILRELTWKRTSTYPFRIWSKVPVLSHWLFTTGHHWLTLCDRFTCLVLDLLAYLHVTWWIWPGYVYVYISFHLFLSDKPCTMQRMHGSGDSLFAIRGIRGSNPWTLLHRGSNQEGGVRMGNLWIKSTASCVPSLLTKTYPPPVKCLTFETENETHPNKAKSCVCFPLFIPRTKNCLLRSGWAKSIHHAICTWDVLFFQ